MVENEESQIHNPHARFLATVWPEIELDTTPTTLSLIGLGQWLRETLVVRE